MIVLGLALAALIGLSLGLLGGGGSILTVPILVYVLGYGAKEAIAMSLAVVGTVSLVGAARHWRNGTVDLRLGLGFGAFAMGGAFLGARLATFVSGTTQLVAFAVVMLLAAASMFRGAGGESEGEAGGRRSLPLVQTGATGVAVGVLTGMVGVGGGFLIVPALVLLARLPMKQAVGTSLLVITMNSAAGFSGYLAAVQVPWAFLSLFAAVAVVGILGGTYLVRFVSQAALRRAFAIFLVMMGSFILYQNRGILLPQDAGGPEAAGAMIPGRQS